jgi:protein phosphatase
MWALQHWFVGVDGSGETEQVAIFRGLNVSIVGFDFFEVDEDTGLALADLTPAARNRVRGGITADDSSDADRILDALRDQRLPECRTPSSAATTTPARPSGTAATPPSPAGTTTATATTTATRTSEAPEPGVDCRRGD